MRIQFGLKNLKNTQMKKLIIILLMLLPFQMMAQDAVDKLFDKYSGMDGFTTVNISGKLLGMASQFEQDDKEAQNMLSSLTGIRILSVDDEALNKSLNFYDELNKDHFFDKIKGEYELLMDVKEKGQVVKFYVKENKEKRISHLLMVVGGDDNALISITGNLDMNEIAKIGQGVHIGGLEHLNDIEKGEKGEKPMKPEKK
jgi:hypothetical protein